MARRFAKISTKILRSSINEEPLPTRWVWLALLTLAYEADDGGMVEGSVTGLARMANVPLKDTEGALERLEAPDPQSQTPDEDGRRLARVDGGWLVLNYERYRAQERIEERREHVADAKRRQRERAKGGDADHGPGRGPNAEATPPPADGDGGRVRVIGMDGRSKPAFTPSEWYESPESWQRDVDALRETEDAIVAAHTTLGWQPTDRAEIRGACSKFRTRTGESGSKLNPASMTHERLKLTLRDERAMLERARAELSKRERAAKLTAEAGQWLEAQGDSPELDPEPAPPAVEAPGAPGVVEAVADEPSDAERRAAIERGIEEVRRALARAAGER